MDDYLFDYVREADGDLLCGVHCGLDRANGDAANFKSTFGGWEVTMSYKSCDGVYHQEPMSGHREEILRAPPGHFWFSDPDENGIRCMYMKLPSSMEQGSYCIIRVREGGTGEGGVWGWDGNLEKPTLTPSIFHDFSNPTSSVAWHGFLRAGRFEGC